MIRALLPLVALAGCYSPDYPARPCTSQMECPGDLVCTSEGLCETSDADEGRLDRVSLVPAGIDFGAVQAGQASAAATFQVIAVEDTGPLAPALAGGDANFFRIVETDCDSALLEAQVCTVGVEFIPQVVRPGHSAVLDVGNSTAVLGGDGVAPGDLSLSPVVVDFGSVKTDLDLVQTITVRNQSNGLVADLVASIPDASDFAITDSDCAALEPDQTCSVDIMFAPSVIGAVVDTLRVAGITSADASTAATASIGGSGVAADQILTVVASGAAGARVVSDPAGINCISNNSSSDCVAAFEFDAPVTLTAIGDLARWEGDCNGSAPSCALVLDRARSLAGRFQRGE